MEKSNFHKLNSRLQELLRRKGFQSLRQIQENSIEELFNQKNLLLVAPTASGKTEAAFLPVISDILNNNDSEPHLSCIYIAPLKALLNDIELRLIELKDIEESQPYILKWHGDVSRSKKLKGIKDKPDILLITPESLEVLFISSYINHEELFKKVKFVVIDEIHNFAISSRGAQLISLISRIQEISHYKIQKIGLSATIGDSKKILDWMTYNTHLKSECIRSKEKSKTAKIKIYNLNEEEEDTKRSKILASLCKDGKTIIFNNSKSFTEEISYELEKINIKCAVHHGSLSKFIREEAEDEIKTEANGVISATSTLELGIDIGDLDKVIQFQSFPSVNSFLQRLGRTGRRSGKNPFIVSITDNDDDFLINLAIISLGLFDRFTEIIIPSKNRYDILLQQLLSNTISYYGTKKEKFIKILDTTFCFSGITESEYHYLINFWDKTEIIRIIDGLILLGEEGEKNFAKRNFLELFSVFESRDQYEVIYDKFSIGVLDSWFVKSKKEKFAFRLAGRKWQVEEIDDTRKLIYVSSTSRGFSPSWIGGSFSSIDYKIAQRVREIISEEYDCEIFNLENDERNSLLKIRKGKLYYKTKKSEILITKTENRISLITYAGTSINSILNYLIKKHSGISPEFIDYFYLSYKKKVFTENKLKELLLKIKDDLNFENIYNIIFNDIEIWKYSKYSEYIPEELNKKYIISEYYNIDDFIKYFNDVKVIISPISTFQNY